MENTNLMEKNRAMHLLLQKAANDVADFEYTAEHLHNMLGAAAYIIDKQGSILAYRDDVKDGTFSYEEVTAGKLNEESVGYIYRYTQSASNIFRDGRYLMIVPITNMGERMGTVVFSRADESFDSEEIMLGEYGAAISAVQLLRMINRKAETEARKKNVVQLALEVLSYSELEAVKYIFGEIEGSEGFLIASKLAEEYKLTRSVIVNALRKLESAGVIDARSLGMKGTYIKVLNDYLYEELEKV